MKRLHWILFLLLILVEPPLPTVAQVLPGTPLPAKVGSPAPAGRFSEEELALFAATTDPFQISGIPVDPGSGRLQKLEPFIEHPVPAYREMARATRDLIALNEIARGEPARAEAEMTELSRQWEGFITDSIFENLGVGPQVDPVARSGSSRKTRPSGNVAWRCSAPTSVASSARRRPKWERGRRGHSPS
jgi:hypothetical protein